MMIALLFLAALGLAYANGANDNMKGVATLLGSGTTGYRVALWWGTCTTFAGSLGAMLLAGKLLDAFSGKGIVPDALVGDPAFLLAVGGGAVGVVMSATVAGLPISTTHALTGGLAGAGLAAAGPAAIAWNGLALAFAVPLLLSPLLLAGSAFLGRGAALGAVGLGMAVGALLQARRVGHCVSFEVTPMNSGQGFTANLVTAVVVIGASRLGLPVSTTHVSVGSLFGLGCVTRGLIRRTFRKILLAWVATLPGAVALAWLAYLLVG